jgi:hypothetical protein
MLLDNFEVSFYDFYKTPLKYIVSLDSVSFIFFRKKTKQKKQHPANSHTQNSINQLVNK